MQIHSPDFRNRLIGYMFLDRSKSKYDRLVSNSQEMLREVFSVADTISFKDAHDKTALNIHPFMVPSNQEEFKNIYIQLIRNMAERFAPNLPLRVNDNTISIRLTGPSLQRMEHALYNTYEKEPYWNQHFNEHYPRLVEMFNVYKTTKTSVDEHEKQDNALFKHVTLNERVFLHINISDDIIATLYRGLYNRQDVSFHEREMTQVIGNLFNPLFDLFKMLHMVLLVNEMYDGLKARTDAHKEAYIRQTVDARQKQFDVYKDWFFQNRIISDETVAELLGIENLLAAERLNELPRHEGNYVLPIDLDPKLPVGLELRLYEKSDDSQHWMGAVMAPELEQPVYDGYNNPAVATVTSLGEGDVVVVNDFLDVHVDYGIIRDTLVAYTPLDGAMLMSELSDQTRETLKELMRHLEPTAKVDVSPVEVAPIAVDKPVEEISLEELMARHGITPQQQTQAEPELRVVQPDPEPQEEDSPADDVRIEVFPSGYRLTSHGDDTFSLVYNEGGGDVLHMSISRDEVKRQLTRLGYVTNFPAMLHCDTDTTNLRSLAHPYVNIQNYLFI